MCACGSEVETTGVATLELPSLFFTETRTL